MYKREVYESIECYSMSPKVKLYDWLLAIFFLLITLNVIKFSLLFLL